MTSGQTIVVTHGSTSIPEVALTFDDGPVSNTPQILAILKQYNVKATFFSIGQNIQQMPGYSQQVLAAGHTIGNHTFTHPHLTTLSADQITGELARTQDACRQVTGTAPTLFRAPYGEYNDTVVSAVHQLGITAVVNWNVQANDWDSPAPSPDEITQRVLSSVGNGSIILLHDWVDNMVAALPAIIQGIQARGLRLVTVPQLIADSHL